MILAAMALLVALQLTPPPDLDLDLDRIVAVVDRDVLTESQMRTEVHIALVWRAGVAAAAALSNAAASPDQVPARRALQRELEDYIINQYLIAGQAKRQGLESVGAAELNARLSHFRQKFSSAQQYRTFLDDHGIGATALTEVIRRDLTNERFIDSRLRTRLLPSEPDAAAAQEAGEAAGVRPGALDAALQHRIALFDQFGKRMSLLPRRQCFELSLPLLPVSDQLAVFPLCVAGCGVEVGLRLDEL